MTAPRMYRKTALAEARQYVTGDMAALALLVHWCGGTWTAGDEMVITVPTLEGPLEARPGDWILKGTRGEFWAVREDIFAETYEPAEGEIPGPGPTSERDIAVIRPEISDEEFEAAKADVIARFGSVPLSLQDVIDRGGRFGRPVPGDPGRALATVSRADLEMVLERAEPVFRVDGLSADAYDRLAAAAGMS